MVRTKPRPTDKGKKKCKKLKRITEHTRKKATQKRLNKETSSSLSTSPFAEFFSTSSTNLDTVSMVTEPSEPSWNFELFKEEIKDSSFFLNWQTESCASFSVTPEPAPTESSGRPSPDISASKLTLTMLSYPGSFTESVPLVVNRTSQPASLFEDIDGLSVWTIETYTSTGLASVASTGRFSRLIQVKYPWSPATNSDVDITSDYPSSVSLIQYIRPSRDTLETIRSVKSTDNLPYFGLDEQEAFDSYLDWVKIKRSKVPFGYVPLSRKV